MPTFAATANIPPNAASTVHVYERYFYLDSPPLSLAMKISLFQQAARTAGRRSAALVIILALLVLLTGVVAIFLSRALIEQKVSSSSANEARVDILARSAVDMITGDLRQEIATNTCSTISYATNSAGTFTNTLYYPLSPTNMVPQRVGLATNSAGFDFAPNLVRRSLRSDTLPIPSRASAINSTTDTSFNGRSISLARWNSHYLIPRANVNSATIDSTPTNYFQAPDWVMVTQEKGPVVLNSPTKDVNGNNVTPIGRYAYAVYDEGGLLDANVAGYPSSIVTSPTQTIDGTAVTINGKSSLALADLTAIGLTSADIDNLVGWRNYATTQPSGSLGGYTFSPPSGTNYYTYVSTTTNGFLSVNPQATSGSRTDQAFTTRQALLKFQRTISSLNPTTGFTQDASSTSALSPVIWNSQVFAPTQEDPKILPIL